MCCLSDRHGEGVRGRGVRSSRESRGAGRGRRRRARLVQAAVAAGLPADPRQRGRLDRSHHRRAVGRRARARPPERALGARVEPAVGARARPRAAVRGDDPAHPRARLPAAGRPGGDRRLAGSSASVGEGRPTARHRSGGGVDRVRRGSGAVARPPLRGRRLRVVRPGRDRPARGAAPGGRRAARRRRSPSRTGRRAGRRARGPRRASTRCGSDSPRSSCSRCIALGRQSEALRAFERLRLAARRGPGHRTVAGTGRRSSAGCSPATRPSRTTARCRPARPGSRSAATRSASRSARAASAWPTAPTSRRSGARWRSRCSARTSPTTRSSSERFEAEAELVARLEHPHIVPLYDYWREPDAAYLVTRDCSAAAPSPTRSRRSARRR